MAFWALLYREFSLRGSSDGRYCQESRSHKRAVLHCNSESSGKKNEPKPKLLGPDIFRWGGVLPREGVGAKKFGMSLETREIKLFWRDIPGFCWDIPVTRAEVWAKNWAKFSAHFRASFAVQNDPQIFSQNSSQFITPCLVAEDLKFYLRELLGFGGRKKKVCVQFLAPLAWQSQSRPRANIEKKTSPEKIGFGLDSPRK